MNKSEYLDTLRISKNNPMFGKHHSIAVCQKLSEVAKTRIGNKNSNWRGGFKNKKYKVVCEQCGEIRFIKYLTYHQDKNKYKGDAKCERCSHIGVNAKEKHPFYGKFGERSSNWRGGKSFEPYSPLFNKQLKDRIRVRDNFICQLCGVPELECKQRLPIHHIDYNKQNCEENNLIALCHKCNAKVNANREYWQSYFTRIFNEGRINV